MRATLFILTSALALGGCASMRNVTLDVRDGEDAGKGALVRAIPLNEGFVPLPLTDDTVQEIVLLRKKEQQAVVDESGAARLRLRAGVPHLVEVMAPAWRGEEHEVWVLEADGASIERADGEAGRYVVRVAR